MAGMELQKWRDGMSRKDLITLFEAAKMLGVHVRTIRRTIKNGKMTAYQPVIGSGALVAREDVERLMLPGE